MSNFFHETFSYGIDEDVRDSNLAGAGRREGSVKHWSGATVPHWHQRWGLTGRPGFLVIPSISPIIQVSESMAMFVGVVSSQLMAFAGAESFSTSEYGPVRMGNEDGTRVYAFHMPGAAY